MRNTALLLLVFVTIFGCGQAPPLRGTEVSTDASGVSEPVWFQVPEGARSITVVVSGEGILGLASLTLADGSEQSSRADASVLGAAYPTWLGTGAQRQFPRHGTFAFQYPMLASQPMPVGVGAVRAATTIPGARLGVDVIVRSGAARTLHISIVSFASTPAEPELPSIAQARRLLAAGGVELVVDERITLHDVGVIETPTQIPEPDDLSVPLVREAHAALHTDALPILLVELHPGTAFSRGIPVPPWRDDDEFAVLVDPTITWPGDVDLALGRVMAHELGHAMGLPHVQDFDATGAVLDDPFDDTQHWDETLMGSPDAGQPISDIECAITPEQAFAMTRSALLE